MKRTATYHPVANFYAVVRLQPKLSFDPDLNVIRVPPTSRRRLDRTAIAAAPIRNAVTGAIEALTSSLVTNTMLHDE
jgi:hypothetical protein